MNGKERGTPKSLLLQIKQNAPASTVLSLILNM